MVSAKASASSIDLRRLFQHGIHVERSAPDLFGRKYKIETMNNITRMKRGETIVSGKVLVTCSVTIIGLWSHSGTGEEWADDDNGMTSADAQAFKRACSCFGLGRYFYDFPAIWVDLDQNRQPVRAPMLSAWALPENWRKGMRPPGKHANEKAVTKPQVRVRTEQATAITDKQPLVPLRPQMATAAMGKA